MINITTKDYLRQTLKIDKEINILLQTIEKLEAETEKTTTYLNPKKVEGQGSFNLHSREDTIVKLIDLKNKVNFKIDKLIDLKDEIFGRIEQIENADYRNLLMLRYINLNSFEEIAVTMCYSYRHVTRMHGWALQQFEKDVLPCPIKKV